MLGQKLINYVERKKFNVSEFFFLLLKLKKIYKKNIVWLDQLDQSYLINPCAIDDCVSYSPVIDKSNKAAEVHYCQSRVSMYQLKNVLMNIRQLKLMV